MERRNFLKQAAAAAAIAGMKGASGQNMAQSSELQGGTADSSLPISSVVKALAAVSSVARVRRSRSLVWAVTISA